MGLFDNFSINLLGWEVYKKGKSVEEVLKETTPPSGILATKSDLANFFVRRYMADPLMFSGSNADLQALLSQQSDLCAEFAQHQNKTISKNAARVVCQGRINEAYAPLINELQLEEYNNDKTAMDAFFKANASVLILFIAVLVIVYLIYKS
jgi:hypothetical protein